MGACACYALSVDKLWADRRFTKLPRPDKESLALSVDRSAALTCPRPE